jgi:cytochrome P450
VPFSGSDRNCIGAKLAIQEAVIMLARVIQKFKIESPNLEEVKMGLDSLLTPIGLKLAFTPIVEYVL